MMFDPDELPTRPDWPSTVARRCKHCGRVYGDHALRVPRPRPTKAPACLNLRAYFDPEDQSDGDRKR
jgi:hypothetical protein